MKFLKNHPFAVKAFFKKSLVLTFAVPKDQLINKIPPCLSLDTFQEEWAFIAIAMVQTKNLRPKGFPKFLGNDFFLIGYRIFVKYVNNSNKRLRGLYIIKSETNKKKMEYLGNVFTHYNYATTDILQKETEQEYMLSSEKSKFELKLDLSAKEVVLPKDSPFSNWKEARRYAGPLPHTFSFNEQENTVLTIQGLRQNWKPAPVKVKSFQFHFLNSLNLRGIVLANAFEIKNIPYEWKKGKIEKWT